MVSASVNKCNICGANDVSLVYTSATNVSLTSLCELIPRETKVYYCSNCTHVYTPPLPNINEYYASDYEILIDSEEEDQIVCFPDGRREYRFDLQVNAFLDKLDIPGNAKILDYGCAKSTTLKKIVEKKAEIVPHVFDVSEMYLSFWKKFIKAENIATFEVKDSWASYFDIVTSFFSLEHVEDPADMMRTVFNLLKSEGYFYCIVPNMYVNPADFIVADHVNHFSVGSISVLMNSIGFNMVSVDTSTHYGAIILVAQKKNFNAEENPYLNFDKQEIKNRANGVAEFWVDISDKIVKFENENNDIHNAAIYGSGFYGALILSTLKNPNAVKCFVDQNIHRQGGIMFDKKIVAPSDLPDDIEIVYVGLNPSVAINSIRDIDEWKNRTHRYCYL